MKKYITSNKIIITITILILFLSNPVFADCSLNLTLNNQTIYNPGDELIATASISIPGTIVFTLIDPLNQNKGTTAITTTTNNASVVFIVKEAWAKGNWTIQAILVTASPTCSDTELFYADTYTVPMDINISANYAMENITKYVNQTINGVVHLIRIDGRIPVGASYDIGDVTLPSYNFSDTIMIGTEKYVLESLYISALENASTKELDHLVAGLEGNNARLIRTNGDIISNLTLCYEERDKCKNGIIESEMQRKDYIIEQHKLNISTMIKDNDKFHFKEVIIGLFGGAIPSAIIVIFSMWMYITWKKKEDEE